MPNHVGNAKRVMRFIADEISETTYVDIMAQYQPHYLAGTEEFYDAISRTITREEYLEVVDQAKQVGLERLYLDRSMLTGGPRLTDSL